MRKRTHAASLGLCGFVIAVAFANAADFDTCLLDNLKGNISETAARAIIEACRNKYSRPTDRTPALPVQEYIELYRQDNLLNPPSTTYLMSGTVRKLSSSVIEAWVLREYDEDAFNPIHRFKWRSEMSLHLFRCAESEMANLGMALWTGSKGAGTIPRGADGEPWQTIQSRSTAKFEPVIPNSRGEQMLRTVCAVLGEK